MKKNKAFKITTAAIILCLNLNLISPVLSYSQDIFSLPPAGIMIPQSISYAPSVLRGVKIFPNEPLHFNFYLDIGDSKLNGEELEEETKKLIKYFLTALTIPDEDQWVNLSPYEKDRIIPQDFGSTEMGRDLLAQDYLLKQITATMIYPENELGAEFWDKVYKKAETLYGTTEIPIDTFNKVWIVPEVADVYENGDSAIVVKSKLKVMLEADYLAVANQNENPASRKIKDAGPGNHSDTQIASEIIREIIIPELEKDVNEGKNFAPLRQIYNSMILATWFKRNLKESFLGKLYVGKNRIGGVDIADKSIKEKIYAQYVETFKKGVYDYIKEEFDPTTQQIIPRKYFSGGFDFAIMADKVLNEVSDLAMTNEIKGKISNGYVKSVNVDLNISTAEYSHSPLATIIENINNKYFFSSISGDDSIKALLQDFARNKPNNIDIGTFINEADKKPGGELLMLYQQNYEIAGLLYYHSGPMIIYGDLKSINTYDDVNVIDYIATIKDDEEMDTRLKHYLLAKAIEKSQNENKLVGLPFITIQINNQLLSELITEDVGKQILAKVENDLKNPIIEKEEKNLDLRAFKAKLLNMDTIETAMRIKNTIYHTGSDKDMCYLQIAAGTDIALSFLLTNMNQFFVSLDYKDITPEEMENMINDPQKYLEEFNVKNPKLLDFYKIMKLNNNFTDSSFLEKKENVLAAIAYEMLAMGANNIKVSGEKGQIKLSFRWSYLGEEEKEYSITFIYADITKPSEYPEILKDKISKKQLLGVGLKAGYKVAESFSKFVPVIFDGMIDGAYFVVDRYALDTLIPASFHPNFEKQDGVRPLGNRGYYKKYDFPPENISKNIRDSLEEVTDFKNPSYGQGASVWKKISDKAMKSEEIMINDRKFFLEFNHESIKAVVNVRSEDGKEIGDISASLFARGIYDIENPDLKENFNDQDKVEILKIIISRLIKGIKDNVDTITKFNIHAATNTSQERSNIENALAQVGFKQRKDGKKMSADDLDSVLWVWEENKVNLEFLDSIYKKINTGLQEIPLLKPSTNKEKPSLLAHIENMQRSFKSEYDYKKYENYLSKDASNPLILFQLTKYIRDMEGGSISAHAILKQLFVLEYWEFLKKDFPDIAKRNEEKIKDFFKQILINFFAQIEIIDIKFLATPDENEGMKKFLELSGSQKNWGEVIKAVNEIKSFEFNRADLIEEINNILYDNAMVVKNIRIDKVDQTASRNHLLNAGLIQYLMAINKAMDFTKDAEAGMTKDITAISNDLSNMASFFMATNATEAFFVSKRYGEKHFLSSLEAMLLNPTTYINTNLDSRYLSEIFQNGVITKDYVQFENQLIAATAFELQAIGAEIIPNSISIEKGVITLKIKWKHPNDENVQPKERVINFINDDITDTAAYSQEFKDLLFSLKNKIDIYYSSSPETALAYANSADFLYVLDEFMAKDGYYITLDTTVNPEADYKNDHNDIRFINLSNYFPAKELGLQQIGLNLDLLTIFRASQTKNKFDLTIRKKQGRSTKKPPVKTQPKYHKNQEIFNEIFIDSSYYENVSTATYSFRDYMNAVLHDEDWGYYAQRVKFGAKGDFSTYPETLSPFFGSMIANQAFKMWQEMKQSGLLKENETFSVVEFGAGNGYAAHDFLKHVRQLAENEESKKEWEPFWSQLKYEIYEFSEKLQNEQRKMLENFTEKVEIHQGDARNPQAAIKEKIKGLVFSNELLDAFGVEKVLFEKEGNSRAAHVLPQINISNFEKVKELLKSIDTKELLETSIEKGNAEIRSKLGLENFDEKQMLFTKDSFRSLMGTISKLPKEEYEKTVRLLEFSEIYIPISPSSHIVNHIKSNLNQYSSSLENTGKDVIAFVNTDAENYFKGISEILEAGYVLTIDYAEFLSKLLEDQIEGKAPGFLTFYNGKAGFNPYDAPTLKDLTTYENLTYWINTAMELGLNISSVGYQRDLFKDSDFTLTDENMSNHPYLSKFPKEERREKWKNIVEEALAEDGRSMDFKFLILGKGTGKHSFKGSILFKPEPKVSNNSFFYQNLIKSISSDEAITASKLTNVPKDVGGIDLNSALLNLNINKEGSGVKFDINPEQLNQIQVDGLVPVIINITPVTSLPMILGENFKENESLHKINEIVSLNPA